MVVPHGQNTIVSWDGIFSTNACYYNSSVAFQLPTGAVNFAATKVPIKKPFFVLCTQQG